MCCLMILNSGPDMPFTYMTIQREEITDYYLSLSLFFLRGLDKELSHRRPGPLLLARELGNVEVRAWPMAHQHGP